MHLLPKPLCKEEYTFYSNRSPDDLRRVIQEELSIESSRFTGFCNAKGVFKISLSNFAFRNEDETYTPTVFIRGNIYSDTNNQTAIQCHIRPDHLLSVFFFGFLIGGSVVLVTDIVNSSVTIPSFGLIVCLLLIPAALLILAYYIKQQLITAFESTFDLRRNTADLNLPIKKHNR